eukprot:scaffold3009_cov108-Isochrysis_galbana.AAC.13
MRASSGRMRQDTYPLALWLGLPDSLDRWQSVAGLSRQFKCTCCAGARHAGTQAALWAAAPGFSRASQLPL